MKYFIINYLVITITIITSIHGQSQKNYDKELRRLNAKIDRVRVLVDSLEFNDRLLLPELMSAFKESVSGKAQQDSITLLMMKRINSLNNKFSILQNKSSYIDSTALEIYNRLVMLENKIVTLTNSYSEMLNVKNNIDVNEKPRFNSEKYRKKYMESLGHFQNEQFDKAITGFSELVKMDATNNLADNCQYWLAECFYSKKDFKRAIGEFEKVFNYPATDKDDDAQLKLGLSYQSVGNLARAKEEFRKIIDYFPGSEYYSKAKEAIQKLSIN